MTTRHMVVVLLLPLTLALSAGVRAEEIPFAERFALAEDREEVLRQLVPGTEDYYYYHCLHYQHRQQFDKVEPLLQAWIQRHQVTPRVDEIRNRQALLTYDQNAEETLAHLRRQMNLRFDHQRRSRDEDVNLPMALDPAQVTTEAFLKRALANHGNLNGIEDVGLASLLRGELTVERRRELLQRLDRPDHPALIPLVVQDLKEGVAFGAYPLHGQLLLDQLEACWEAVPGLGGNHAFVQSYLARLSPGPDEDAETNRATREAYIARLRTFVDRLPPAFNSLKAQVLYQQLVHDRQSGVYDRDRFLAYLALPRSMPYVRPEYFQERTRQEPPADLQSSFSSHLPWGPIGNDEPLVRAFFEHFFVEATGYDEFREWVKEEYLREVFAETKLLFGLGDADRYLSWLTPAAVQRLRDRVDLDFLPTNRQIFSGRDPVRLELFTKNVSTLIVKVYEINAANFYRENRREIDTDINLDGLTPNWEQTYRYDAAPIRREKRAFEFPELAGRGVYVIDFIGSGRSSRVVVRRGALRFVSRTTTSGQMVMVLDEQNQHLPEATLELEGRVFTSNQRGEILIPFSTQPRDKPIILGEGGAHSLQTFPHEAESYQLKAGIYVDRESLLDGRQATILVRPSLLVGRTPVSLSILKNVRMRVTATDQDGVPTSFDVEEFRLFEDRDTAIPIQVPSRLAKLECALTAEVTPRTQSDEVRLVVSETFTLNGMNATQAIESLQLMRTAEGYSVEVLGRTGEVRAGLPVQIQLKHREFRDTWEVMLKTDERGRVALGMLEGMESVRGMLTDQVVRRWSLVTRRQSFLRGVHGVAGQPLEIPYPGITEEDRGRELFSLLELRNDQFVADRFSSLSVQDGALRINDLPAGDYDLLLKEFGERIRVRLVAGASWQGFVLGERRLLESRDPRPVRVASVVSDDSVVRLQLANADPFTRVHIVATRYVPEFDIYARLAAVRDAELSLRRYAPHRSSYVEGRSIGDEYRYIIDRKYQAKFPGNMLARPSLLLNPWAVRDTSTSEQVVAPGQAFDRDGAPPPSEAMGDESAERIAPEVDLAGNLDYLADTSVSLLNLRADSRGVIELEISELGDRQHLHIVLIHPRSTAYQQLALADRKVEKLDRRLTKPLDATRHFVQKKQVRLFDTGQPFTLEDVTSSRFVIYDSRQKLFALFATLVNDENLARFQWITKWHTFDDSRKKELYSEYACHELHFFLHQRDAEFFEQVVVSTLRQKREKQFLDHWLLGEDLQAYRRPLRYAQLNTLERILLAERLGNRDMVAREIEHDLALRASDLARTEWLFEAAVAGGSLQSLEVRLGFAVPASPVPASDFLSAARPERAMAESGRQSGSGPADRMLRRDMALGRQPQHFFDQRLNESETLISPLFRALDKTREWAETHYYQQRLEIPPAERIRVNRFWLDYARHGQESPFVSSHFTEVATNLSEVLVALTLIDLPAEAAEHEQEFEEGSLTLKPGSPLLVLFEEIQEAEAELEGSEILVNQSLYRLSERSQNLNLQSESGESGEVIGNECLVHDVYGCQVVVTNSTSRTQTLDLLLQIPEGAMPLAKGRATSSRRLRLDPFQTHKLDYFFYFPHPGSFAHYPVQVSRDGRVVAAAKVRELQAVTRLSEQNRQSWEYIAQQGTAEEVLQFLRAGNLQAVELDDLAWRMRDADLFGQVLEQLQSRQIYSHTLWSYGVFHNDVAALRPFLEMSPDFVARCGPYLESSLVRIDPVERRLYEHLEYRPLVNARVHPLAGRREILNDRFASQYRRLMDILSCRRQLDDSDRMAAVYYLLLQDRVEEARKFFARVDPERLVTEMQYDYFAAYLDFFQPDPQRARTIAAKYLQHPVDAWRKLFAAVESKLDELDGADVVAIDQRDRDQQQTRLAATGANVELKVEAGQITVDYQNIDDLVVNFYEMDIELLFSRNPFVQGQSGQFSWIRPHLSEVRTVDRDESRLVFPLPEKLRNRNVLVEVTAQGVRRWQPYYANSLRLQLHTDFGQLRVLDENTSRPLSPVYVKVYARLQDGQIVFYKDGYTDLRGRFDYASLSTNQLDQVERFALLVLSDDQGAEVREIEPPAR